mmetsp:Transcript_77796/g.223408  ORF Transcript_77796/g.223408 Transcript_77796/m.223408 type:complete len:117 (+) Transcript_77796:66-416(+)|eukprot:CAMPEP_0119541168 /NCGR_PEP_ID=MMETSP1344-20130328/52802_1 /TAXON_ID=236787 /ORGANISM="Florenciella parvula, Strain CCMP2471" /LENGTH=116 /DNA_ID=CAMNT_0007585101 /DNA_START=35 /DNA_END=385 /DNA_ORIENTATION=-
MDEIGISPPVNGATLQSGKFAGKRVRLIGKVLAQDGETATIEASDGQQVNVELVPGTHMNSTYVAITGQASDDSSMNVREEMNCELSDNFSMENHNQLVEISAKFPDLMMPQGFVN